MKKIRAASLALAFSLAAVLPGAEPAAPKIDKAKWETFLRYAEGYTASVKFNIDDPKPTSIPGYFEVVVHLSNGDSKLDRSYYVGSDGQSILNGTLWDLRQAPFAENLKKLPTSGYSFGPEDAPVRIVVFSDFQCPYCSELAKTMRSELPKKYGDKVHVIFEDFPLTTRHPWARAASESAHCLGEQKADGFWAFHDWIFAHQQEVSLSNLREKTLAFAKEQKLDEGKVASCLDNHTPGVEIDKSIELARSLQVAQTPTFFVNGRMETGALPWDRLSALIDFELNRPKEFAAGGAEKCCEVVIPKVVQK
jgi:protein-disulfide isomerase